MSRHRASRFLADARDIATGSLATWMLAVAFLGYVVSLTGMLR